MNAFNSARWRLSVARWALLAGAYWLSALPAVATEVVEMAPRGAAASHFVRSDAPTLVEALPLPPAVDSLAAQADLLAVLQAQTWRTPAQVDWARRAEKGQVFDFAEVLGPWFKREKAPLTDALMRDLSSDATPGIEAAKRHYARPRPFLVDAQIAPCVKAPTSGSYPSGHAVNFFLDAGVLSEVFPEKRTELFSLAGKLAWGRVLGGVHFPSDLMAGKLLAAAILEQADLNPEFQAALAACKSELRGISGGPKG